MNLAATVYAPPHARAPWHLNDIFAPAALRLHGHGRNALASALRLAGAEGGRVLLPAFICRDMLSSVAAVGAEAVFYGTSADLSADLDSARWPVARAVLAVDYFGFAADLSPFEAYARRCGAVVIEDAAHGLFSRDSTGRLLGTRAPLGILSLRKSLPLPNGGALLANDPALAASMPAQLSFKAHPGYRPMLKAAARPLLALAGAVGAHAGLTAWRALRGDASGNIGPGFESERVLPKPAEPCVELGRALVCADPALESERRRALWTRCDALARRAGLIPVFPFLPAGTVPYAYAFRGGRNKARPWFAAEGLNVLPWPDLPSALASSAPEHHRNVALVHFLW